MRRHICDYRFKLFMEKSAEGFRFGECTSPEAPSDWREYEEYEWCLTYFVRVLILSFILLVIVKIVGRE